MEEEYQYSPEDIERYRPAQGAAVLYQQKDVESAKGVLENLVTTLDWGRDGKSVIDQIKKSTEGGMLLADVFSRKYDKAVKGSKVNDLFGFYSEKIKDLIGEEKHGVAQGYFKEYGDKTYGELKMELDIANSRVKNLKNLSKEELAQINEEKAKLERITATVDGFENLEIQEYMDPKGTFKKILEQLYSKSQEPKE